MLGARAFNPAIHRAENEHCVPVPRNMGSAAKGSSIMLLALVATMCLSAATGVQSAGILPGGLAASCTFQGPWAAAQDTYHAIRECTICGIIHPSLRLE